MSIERELRDLKKRLNAIEAQLAKIPSRIGSGGGGGGSEDAIIDKIWAVEPLKTDLPDPGDGRITLLGRVEGDGYDDGMVCVINPDKTGWDAINFFE